MFSSVNPNAVMNCAVYAANGRTSGAESSILVRGKEYILARLILRVLTYDTKVTAVAY